MRLEAGPLWLSTREGAQQTFVRSEVEKMKAAVDADLASCGCNPREFAPPHYTGHYRLTDGDHYGYTYRCSSFSRHYDPYKGEMVGRAHCSCDFCF